MQQDVWINLKKYGKRKGLSEEQAEDYASEAFIRLFQGRKATIEQLLIDFKRKEFGNSRSKYFRFRESKTVDELETIGRLDLPCSGVEPCSDETGRDDLHNGFCPTGRGGLIWELVHDCGFEALEIATWYGISQSRISQILRKVKKEFESHVLLNDLKNKLEDNQKYLELDVDWIVL